MKFATKAIHEGQEPDPQTGAVNVPVYLSTTFKQDGIGNFRGGNEYARTGNPSRRSLEKTIASLESGRFGLCFASGSAATTAVVDMLRPGDEVVTTIDVYGGTYRLFKNVYSKYGIKFHCLDTADTGEVLNHVNDKTRMIWIESPTNPLLNIHDIERLARGKSERTLLIVDNTFATPRFQRPLELGADIVVHSVTKYLAGHSDVVGGAIITSSEEVHESCAYYQNAAGGVPSPFDCYLVQRGIKTLDVRMQRHEQNAIRLAEYLKGHPKIDKIYFPGFADHPGHEIGRRQMSGWSGMISFEINGGRPAVDRFMERLGIFALAESLGGVESLACYPFTMTHGAIPVEDKLRIGIQENLARLSVGIESADDLIDDVKQALD